MVLLPQEKGIYPPRPPPLSAGAACVVPHEEPGSLLIGDVEGGVVVVVVAPRVAGVGGGGGEGGVGGRCARAEGGEEGEEERRQVLQSLQQVDEEKPPPRSVWVSTISAPWTPVLEEVTLRVGVQTGQQQVGGLAPATR